MLTEAQQLEQDMLREGVLYGEIFLVRSEPDGKWRVLKQSEYDITVTPKAIIVDRKET